MLNYTRT